VHPPNQPQRHPPAKLGTIKRALLVEEAEDLSQSAKILQNLKKAGRTLAPSCSEPALTAMNGAFF
jgi:hypothetical protein